MSYTSVFGLNKEIQYKWRMVGLGKNGWGEVVMECICCPPDHPWRDALGNGLIGTFCRCRVLRDGRLKVYTPMDEVWYATISL